MLNHLVDSFVVVVVFVDQVPFWSPLVPHHALLLTTSFEKKNKDR
jgi:hypothetical protein